MTGRLVRVELRRYLAREGVRWLVVGMVAAVLLTGFAAWRSSRSPSEAQLAEAQHQYAMAQADWAQHGEQYLADCRANEKQVQRPEQAAGFSCEDMVPSLDRFLPMRETFAGSAVGWLGQVATFVLLLSLIVGATLVAAEFSTGSMSTWLTFEPRRGCVFASKVVVPTVVTGAAALVVAGVAVGVFWAATAVNHATGHVTAQTLIDLGNGSARIAVAAAGAALLGAVLGFLTRHTAAVIAAVIAWLIAVDQILISALLRAPRWSVAYNVQAWLAAGFEQTVGSTSCTTDAAGTVCNGTTLVITMTQAGLLLAALLAVATVLALLVFRRRDVA